MQCPYCGRDIPDDAHWCPYCGGEQTPPEDDLQNEILPPEDQQDASAPPDDGNGEHFPSGWQDSAPAGDWDDEAELQDDPWADDPSGWEDDAPYEPAPEDRDAPRSKALLIAIFAALGVALIVLLIALNVKPKPKDPVVAATPAVTATVEPSAAPTPTPDPLSTLPYEDGQLYAAAYLGYQAPTDLDFFRQTYFGGRELPVHHISDGDFYLIIPRDPNATVRLYKNDMVTDSKTLFYEQTNGDAFVIGCNVSDIFPDVTVSITSGGETVDFSPYISLKDGSVQVGECGLNITRISTSP